MDNNPPLPSGQQKVIIEVSQLDLIGQLCNFMQMLRAWWEHFQNVIRYLDRSAAAEAYDLIIEGVITARQLARTLNIPLHDVSTMDWGPGSRRAPPSH